MKFLSMITSNHHCIINSFLSDFRNVLIAVLSICVIIFAISFEVASSRYPRIIKEMNDSVCTYRNKIGEQYSIINAYVTDINELKKENSELFSEVKNLKENPIVVTKVSYVVKTDTVRDIVTITDSLSDKKYNIGFSKSDDFMSLSGNIGIDIGNLQSSMEIFDMSFSGNVYLDVIDRKKDGLAFIARSDNPYFMINNIKGVVLSPENSKVLRDRFDRKWCIVAGIGPSVSVIDGNVGLFPAVGITLGYKLISF